MTKPVIETRVSIGNIISWALVVAGFIAGYVKLQEAQAYQGRDVDAIKSHIAYIQRDYQQRDADITASVHGMSRDLAVIKEKVTAINEKVDDLRKAKPSE